MVGRMGSAVLSALSIWSICWVLFTWEVSAQSADDSDVSAAYDYDGVLVLDSGNFRGMTQSGVWVVFIYSFSIVIKDRSEAHNCQRLMWMWGDFATRSQGLGGTPTSGEIPSLHIAKMDASFEMERVFIRRILRQQTIDSLPAIVIVDGGSVRVLPQSKMDLILSNLPDIDRLEGYSDEMECDPPEDYYEAYSKNFDNMGVVADFIADYMLEKRGIDFAEPADVGESDKSFYSGPAPKAELDVDDWDPYDPTLHVMEGAREAARTGEASALRSLLVRMEAVNGTNVNCRNAQTLQTPLHFAAVGGETDVLELLLASGADRDAVCGDGETALCKAAESGRRGVVRALLRAGARVNVPRDPDGATPLHMAALVGHADVCRTLIRAGADVEARTPKGHSPLHFAAMGGQWKSGAAQVLLDHGADIDGQDYIGETALVHAIKVNEPEMTSLLCELGADVRRGDVNGDTPLHHAMHCGFEAHVRELLRRGAPTEAENRRGERAGDCLSAWNNWKTDPMTGKWSFTAKAKAQFDAILRPHRMWWWPGYWFGPYMRSDWVFTLERVEKRATEWIARRARAVAEYYRGKWHTYYASLVGQSGAWHTKYDIFTQKRLLEVEEFVDKQTWGGDNEGDVWLFDMGNPEYERMKSYTELQRAVKTGQDWLVERLLRAGAVPWASGGGAGVERDTTQVLIPSDGGGTLEDADGGLRDQGGTVDVEVRDEAGRTPVMMAAAQDDVRIVRILARYGADLNAADEGGYTALKRAAADGRAAMVEALLELGAAPDRASAADGGQTAMMLACAAGRRDVVEALLRGGADLDRQDALGRTPLNYAAAARQTELAEWLRGMGATMRGEDGLVRGFPPRPAEASSYSPVDDPDHDQRNPRYTGSFG